MRRATYLEEWENKNLIGFQSTLSVRRATSYGRRCRNIRKISIHALREESDQSFAGTIANFKKISIHALREESDTATDDNRIIV